MLFALRALVTLLMLLALSVCCCGRQGGYSNRGCSLHHATIATWRWLMMNVTLRGGDHRPVRCEKNRIIFFEPFMYHKNDHLPRQVRDKHRESTQERDASPACRACSSPTTSANQTSSRSPASSRCAPWRWITSERPRLLAESAASTSRSGSASRRMRRAPRCGRREKRPQFF